MSNDVVISKELQKDYETYLNCELEETDGMKNEMVVHHREQVKKRLATLLSAPETVSLEGVEKELTRISKDLSEFSGDFQDGGEDQGFLERSAFAIDEAISDLRRLVAPVQPSAGVGSVPTVVSIVSILSGYAEKLVNEDWNSIRFRKWHNKARAIHALLTGRTEGK